MMRTLFGAQMVFFLLYGIISGAAIKSYVNMRVEEAEIRTQAEILFRMTPAMLTEYQI